MHACKECPSPPCNDFYSHPYSIDVSQPSKLVVEVEQSTIRQAMAHAMEVVTN